jgi:UDP-N-acetylmuramoyl-tripeptide--D-alanyl-D-alanine ligase
MEPTRFDTLARWAGGRLASGAPSVAVTTICTDSRTLRGGDLFVALKGSNFDGHDFLADAARLGASGAVVEHVPEGLPEDFSVIKVEDALAALQRIAAEYRRSLPVQVVCVTGSNGKTSTKDFTWHVVRERFQASRTEGNLNNHIGLPLTMLKLRAGDRIGVFEIGMNHAGEIAPLAALAQPDVAIITNIGVAHIENLGSREAIAEEKGALATALQPSGTVILNADDPFSPSIAARTKADVLTCGLGETADIRAVELRQDFSGLKFRIEGFGRRVEASLPVLGLHMVQNALLAVGAGHVFGMTLEECAEGLGKVQLSRGRLELRNVRGVQILDDTYNANPDSVKAALRTLAQMSTNGRRAAVLGRMGELGAESEPGHREVGQTASHLGLDAVITVGEDAKWIAEEAWRGGVARVIKAADHEEAVIALREWMHAGDIVLVKGSRSSQMEKIIEGLASA